MRLLVAFSVFCAVSASSSVPTAVIQWSDGTVFAEPGVWSPLPVRLNLFLRVLLPFFRTRLHLLATVLCVRFVPCPCFSAPHPQKDSHDSLPVLALRRAASSDPFGCSVDPALPAQPPAAVVVLRGRCSFQDKATAAAASGAAAVIVANSLEGVYNAASTGAVGPALNTTACDYDCGLGSGVVAAAQVSTANAYAGYDCGGGRCGVNRCVLTGVEDASSGDRQVCCLADDFMEMGGTAAFPVPTVFVTVDGHAQLATYLAQGGAGAPVTVAMRHTPTLDPSSVIIWGIGVFAVAAASLRSAAVDRDAASRAGRGSTAPPASPQADDGVETMAVTVKGAAGFLLVATLVLLGLFFLIKLGVQIVYLVIAIFCVGAVSSTAHILLRPAVLKLAPSWNTRKVAVPFCGQVPAHVAATVPAAIGLVVWWLVTRHSSYAFVLQDTFGVCLCCMFLLQVRLPNVKVAVVLLTAFFFYDIFMVFISPVFFGDSVMVNVATAGMPTAVMNQVCYCRLHPDDSKHCGPGEAMPILFRFPRLLDYRGGSAMLGLGDVVLPGLLLSYAARLDVASRRKAASGYFLPLLVGYGVGLACANMAVILMRQGQPALLYIVPATLIPFVALAHCRGDLRNSWTGDALGAAGGYAGIGGAGPATSSAHVPLTTDTDDADVEDVESDHQD